MIKIIKKLNRSGITLIETLITMGFLSGLLLILITIFTSAVDVQQESKSYSAMDSNGRFITARLNYDIANATSITAPTFGNSSSSLTLDEKGTTYSYNLSGSNLQLSEGSNTANLNSDDVTATYANFWVLGNPGGKPTVLYSFTLYSTAQVHGATDAVSFSSTAGLR